MNRKICVVTGSRADYGLLKWLMQGLNDAEDVDLQVIVTGAHLSTLYGDTWQEIAQDGFRIDRKVDMQLGDDTSAGIGRAMSRAVAGFGEALKALRPDVLVVLGDRYEILSVVSAALVAGIPVAHLHGGEMTEGAFDEAIRHAVTKMSHLHFVAAEAYRRRVIQLGEQPERVFLVGGLGVDAIRRVKLMERDELEALLGVELGPRSLLITYHPVTLEQGSAAGQVSELLAALAEEHDTRLIFTMPNADTENREITARIEDFVAEHDNARAFVSLGQLGYLSCLSQVDGVVGNSSSGLAEAPSFHKGTVNIGDRQKGRLKANSVIDCEPNKTSILEALRQLRSAEFQQRLATVTNPYGEGGASQQIVEVLRTYPLEGILKKTFYDLPQ